MLLSRADREVAIMGVVMQKKTRAGSDSDNFKARVIGLLHSCESRIRGVTGRMGFGEKKLWTVSML